ncbi:hypothetical protein SEA_CHARM_52 [Mycobacterium phage Charm]|nr:hypothetical protein SEA_CHARM_52 [Mycobacterium phage Charm]QGJ88332.1 hypothetical protein SEA_DREAMTEAM1_52 [Mycobacterium phage DreamTeam1]
MRENTGRGWVDKGPRKAVKGWDGAMRSIKPTGKPPKETNEDEDF